MDAFSYLSVLNSIVLGLGFARVLTGFAEMVRSRRRLVLYWPLAAQMVLIFLIQVQLWWALFVLREVTHWSFVGFFVVLMQPVLVYLATAFLIPDIRDTGRLDLREAYFREARWYFGALLLVLLDSLAKNVVIYGHPQSGWDLVGHAAFIVLCIVGIASRHDVVHKFIAPLSLMVFGAYIALLFAALPT